MKRVLLLYAGIAPVLLLLLLNAGRAGAGDQPEPISNAPGDTLLLSEDAVMFRAGDGRHRLVIQSGLNSGAAYADKIISGSEYVGLPDSIVRQAGPDAVFRLSADAPGRLRVECGGRCAEFIPVGVLKSTGTISGDTLAAEEVWPGVDISQRLGPRGVKERLVLTRPGCSRFEYDLNTCMEPVLDGAGALLLRDGERVLLEIPPPWALDAAGKSLSAEAALKEGASGRRYIITVDTAGAVYPVVVDPGVVFREGEDGYTGVEDTYLEKPYESDYGSRVFAFMGVYSSAIARPLLRFEFPSALDSVYIESAYLTLFRYTSMEDTVRYGVHLLAKKFYEGTGSGSAADGDESTWFYRLYPDTLWAKAGADSAGADYYPYPAVFDTLAGIAAYDSFTVDITPLVRKITGADKCLPNFGFIFRGLDTAGVHRMNWIASDHESLSLRPKLSLVTRQILLKPFDAVCAGLTDSSLLPVSMRQLMCPRGPCALRYGYAACRGQHLRRGRRYGSGKGYDFPFIWPQFPRYADVGCL